MVTLVCQQGFWEQKYIIARATCKISNVHKIQDIQDLMIDFVVVKSPSFDINVIAKNIWNQSPRLFVYHHKKVNRKNTSETTLHLWTHVLFDSYHHMFLFSHPQSSQASAP